MVRIGNFFSSTDDLEQLIFAVYNEQPVYLADIATIEFVADIPSQNVLMATSDSFYPAVTVAVAKQAGENAVSLAHEIRAHLDKLQNRLIPDNIHIEIVRDYGETADEKANKLIGKLLFATMAVVVLVALTMGWREALVVGIAIVITLATTLFASWAWGFTLNRISLFALIFSIGILVDDAIVVVENIHRHASMGKISVRNVIPAAVDEVGRPTILATLTVIAALLPMAFVTGLMGPYMSPIPINASTGMLLSLLIAFMITPWLSQAILKPGQHAHDEPGNQLVARAIRLFLIGKHAAKARSVLALAVLAMIAVALCLPAGQWVVMKMLPFDNKSEFQVVLDMPAGTSLEETQAVLSELTVPLSQVPEVADLQIYAGTAAPINFNGLVRHYFLRSGRNQGDIQVNLVGKHQRERTSHEIAVDVRPQLQAIADHYQARLRVVEVPPGPPVWSPIVAEVYGPNAAVREAGAADNTARHHRQTCRA